MQTYNGSCHCGAIKFRLHCQPITKGLRCNCSMCRRKGAMMLGEAVDESHLQIHAKTDDLGLYQFDSKVAKHFFCRRCGIYTHHETARYPGKFRVNLGCIDEIDPLTLDFDVFDGKNWTPTP